MPPAPARPLVAPALASGLLMAAYLVLRPYGDTGTAAEAAAAFASDRWLLAHLCGAGALAGLAWLTTVWRRVVPTRTSTVAAAAAAVGAALALPYYGAEMYGLHALGAAAGAGGGVDPALVASVRMQPVAISLFVLGLLGLGLGLVVLALGWRTQVGVRRWAPWPVAVLTVLVLPQYELPPAGRVAFGLAFLGACLALAHAATRVTAPVGTLAR